MAKLVSMETSYAALLQYCRPYYLAKKPAILFMSFVKEARDQEKAKNTAIGGSIARFVAISTKHLLSKMGLRSIFLAENLPRFSSVEKNYLTKVI